MTRPAAPMHAFATESWSRFRASMRGRRAGSPLAGAMILILMLILLPVAIAMALAAVLLVMAWIGVRLAIDRLRRFLPRRDGRENVRVITHR